ncbi:selenocysteine-specific translation elongation factor [Desulfogranum japonicum]|uniref:selenocysteine-specific translation elongation factor n=1 Tax=Desulfogranum japonicum TaxID=231447 RepID=UPI00048B8318|nr:selenocysteine-specific translation elongation factor [Desulfogranum japonicum]
MREIILGTAGHVDHGKTSFIRALTGVDTDRLKEEKQRGITIVLGFAHLDLPCGHRLGIIDVPGHEKFIRNMVAGAAGMDLVAFIIAADEGIMPQTKEHFDICRLLGVQDGLIILTKKDMVEPDWLEMVEEEVREYFSDSFLEDAPVLAVSSTTGEGIDQVISELDNKVKAIQFQEEFGPFRLAVDRVFTMKGFGTVITGTSLSGRIEVGAEVMAYPRSINARIRGIQVHGKDVELVEAGHRTAINLQGIEKDDIQRGDVIASPGSMIVTTLLDCSLTYLDTRNKNLKNRTRVRVHIGTREIFGTVLLMRSDEVAPGEETDVQILLQEPVVAWPGDRYVLRSYSPVTTIGGGVVFNVAPPKRKRATSEIQAHNAEIFSLFRQEDPAGTILHILKESGYKGLTGAELHARMGIFGKKMTKLLQQPISAGDITVVDSESRRMLAAPVMTRLQEQILAYLQTFHKDNPLKETAAKEELRSQLKPLVDAKLFQYALNGLEKKSKIEQSGAEVKLAGYSITLQVDEQDMQERISELYLTAGLTPPNLKDVLAEFTDFKEQQIMQIISLLLQKEILIKITESLYYHQQVITKLHNQLEAFLLKEREIAPPQFKDLTGLTRKFSIPLLEYFDKIKLTIRVGDKRQLRKR